MEQSLIAAVSGIEANQTYLDVIGNNIANSDTTGYKAEDPVFTDLLAEQIAGASAPSAGRVRRYRPHRRRRRRPRRRRDQRPVPGGHPADQPTHRRGHPGRRVSWWPIRRASSSTPGPAISPSTPTATWPHPPGRSSRAGRPTARGHRHQRPRRRREHSQRPGHERPGHQHLQHGRQPPGLEWQRHPAGGHHHLERLRLPRQHRAAHPDLHAPWPAPPTPGPSRAPSPTARARPTCGRRHRPSTSTPPRVRSPASPGSRPTPTVPTRCRSPPCPPVPSRPATPGTIDFPAPGSINAVTQFGGEQTAQLTTQNGNSAGTLESFTIGGDGVISGAFSNGLTEPIAQLALATFSNPTGLIDDGNLMYSAVGQLGSGRCRNGGDRRPGHPARRRPRGLQRRPGHRADRHDRGPGGLPGRHQGGEHDIDGSPVPGGDAVAARCRRPSALPVARRRRQGAVFTARGRVSRIGPAQWRSASLSSAMTQACLGTTSMICVGARTACGPFGHGSARDPVVTQVTLTDSERQVHPYDFQRRDALERARLRLLQPILEVMTHRIAGSLTSHPADRRSRSISASSSSSAGRST